MNEREMDTLIGKMKEVFPTREEFTSVRGELASVGQEFTSFGENLTSFRKEANERLDSIEKDLKSVVRIYDLDEEMTAVYNRIKRLEEKTGIVS